MLLNITTRITDRLAPAVSRPLLCITEGVLDISCLTTFSQILHAADADIPDLYQLADQGKVIFLPAGGGDLAAWATRLAPLACPEFFLCDREQFPETELRQRVVDHINIRSRCYAALTKKRSLENYLHPVAIAESLGVTIEINDETPVAELVARSQIEPSNWSSMPRRHQQRLIYRVKRRLNFDTARQMTAEQLADRDPQGEILGWFRTIARLLT